MKTQTKSGTGLFIVLLMATACGGPMEAGDSDAAGTGRNSAMIEPQGWKEVYMISGNSARVFGRGEITLNSIGHFKISRNDCYKEAWGAVELDHHNRLTDALNRIVQMQLLPEEQCFNRPSEPRDYKLDYSADLITERGKIALFDVRGYFENARICTRVPDVEVARQALEVLDQVLPMAYREDCATE